MDIFFFFCKGAKKRNSTKRRKSGISDEGKTDVAEKLHRVL